MTLPFQSTLVPICSNSASIRDGILVPLWLNELVKLLNMEPRVFPSMYSCDRRTRRFRDPGILTSLMRD